MSFILFVENFLVYHLCVVNKAEELPWAKINLINGLSLLHVNDDDFVVFRMVWLVGEVGVFNMVRLRSWTLRNITCHVSIFNTIQFCFNTVSFYFLFLLVTNNRSIFSTVLDWRLFLHFLLPNCFIYLSVSWTLWHYGVSSRLFSDTLSSLYMMVITFFEIILLFLALLFLND